jgi:glycosyltransferase involved in cell wall biosynthesis
MPPLEAMHCGCPVICSDASCIPEIVGDAGLYFQPESSDDLADNIERLIDDQELRHALVEKGTARIAGYTWERCAEETLAAYESV